MGLRGSQVVVVGGSSGMGFATAQAALAHDAKVTIVGRSLEKLQRAAKDLGDVRAVVADVTSESNVQRLFDEFPSVDHVFVSAGQFAGGGVMDTELETLRLDVEQRLWGLIYVVRSAVPKMAAGSITCLSGLLSSRPAADAVVTSAMHAAVEALAKGLALELAPLRVNAVAPGLVDTPAWGESRDQVAEWASGKLPVGRIGRPEDVAQTVMMLMTNDFITGEVVHVDGGGRYV
jgi:NAD(P)-dependent dehydrogenase (short-subunit alcohol dehydrogenase family)